MHVKCSCSQDILAEETLPVLIMRPVHNRGVGSNVGAIQGPKCIFEEWKEFGVVDNVWIQLIIDIWKLDIDLVESRGCDSIQDIFETPSWEYSSISGARKRGELTWK